MSLPDLVAPGLPQPLVSVIVPAFNVAPYLREAVDSALSQTVADLEVLVVDDGSSDDSAHRLAVLRDPRLRILRQQHRGLAEARNAGIRETRGRLIAFLDGDDRWEPDKLARHIAYLGDHPEVDLSFALHGAIDASGAPHGLPVRRSGGILSFGDILVEPPGGKAVLRRDVLDRSGLFDPGLEACEDIELWLRIARVRPGNVALIPQVLDWYRRRPGQMTEDWRMMLRAWRQVRERARALAPDEFDAVAACAEAAWLAYLAYLAQEHGEHRVALTLMRGSFVAHPASWMRFRRRWLLCAACLAGAVLPARVHRSLLAGGVGVAKRLGRHGCARTT